MSIQNIGLKPRKVLISCRTVQPVKSGGSRQKIPDWKLLPWEISARGWTEETHVDLGSLKEYSEIYTILREDRFGFGIRRLAILFEPLLGFNVRDLVSSSHPVNGRDVYVMEPLYLAKFFDLNRPTIESDRDAPEILLTKRAKEYSHPYDVSLLRERIRRVVVQEIHRLLRTLIEEFVAGVSNLSAQHCITADIDVRGQCCAASRTYEPHRQEPSSGHHDLARLPQRLFRRFPRAWSVGGRDKRAEGFLAGVHAMGGR